MDQGASNQPQIRRMIWTTLAMLAVGIVLVVAAIAQHRSRDLGWAALAGLAVVVEGFLSIYWRYLVKRRRSWLGWVLDGLLIAGGVWLVVIGLRHLF
jgi:hypothetical protein